MDTIQQKPKQISRLKKAYKLLLTGNFKVVIKEFFKRLYSESISFGLKRDLAKNFEARDAKIEIGVRRLHSSDLNELLSNTEQNPVDPRLIDNQRALAEAGLPHCYVAVTKDDKPCYMQWLIGYEDNDKIEAQFGDTFPALNEGEALLEGAYGNPAYRGLGIMPAAMSKIAEKGNGINARWINTFVDVTNIASLKGCHRSGFEPYLLRRDKWRLFKRYISFHKLRPELLEDYYENMGGNPKNQVHKNFKPMLNNDHVPKTALEQG